MTKVNAAPLVIFIHSGQQADTVFPPETGTLLERVSEDLFQETGAQQILLIRPTGNSETQTLTGLPDSGVLLDNLKQATLAGVPTVVIACTTGQILKAEVKLATVGPTLLEAIGPTVKVYRDPEGIGFDGREVTPPPGATLGAINEAIKNEKSLGGGIFFSADHNVLQYQLPTQTLRYVLVSNENLGRVPKNKGWERASPEEGAIIEKLSIYCKIGSFLNNLLVRTAMNIAGIDVVYVAPYGIRGHGWGADSVGVLYRVP